MGFNVTNPDMAYISVIFKKNANIARSCAGLLRLQYPDIIIDIGGPGYDLKKELPPDIERTQPDYTLYKGMSYALGFTTRGCIRKCPFCVVPIKEGGLRYIQPIENIYRPEYDAIKLLDNNILADMDNFKHVAKFCIDHNLKLDISQGLDARLLTEESARLLKQIVPLKTFTFAFDSLAYRPAVERAVKLMKDAHIDIRGRVQFYVYCDDSITGEYGILSAVERCNILKSLGTNPYVMLDIDRPPSRDMKNLKRWANRKAIFWTVDFNDYSTKKGAVA